MNEDTRTNANRLGAFDLFKGIGLAAIVLNHSIGLFEGCISGMQSFIVQIFNAPLMAAFFVISGYGFRKTRIKKCIRLQSRFMLLPYLYTAAGSVLLFSLLYYGLFYRGNLGGLLMESVRVAGGFLFGFAYSADYFGFLVYHCGPMWYMLAFFFGWIFLDIILNVIPQRFVPAAVFLTATAGWLLGRQFNTPFCLAQSMVIVLYLYLGYAAKQRKLFEDRRSGRYVLILLISAACIIAAAFVTDTINNISRGTWSLGSVGIVINGVFACSTVYFLRRWNYRDSRVAAFFESIGHRSLIVFCLHTVEMQAIPWNHLPAYFENSVFLGILSVFLLRCGVIVILYLILIGIKKLFRSIQKASA